MDYVPPVTIQASIQDTQLHGFKRAADTAQYKGSDYSNAIRVARGISLEEAFTIAQNDPEIDYFFYTKGFCMVLEIPEDASFEPNNDELGLVSVGNHRLDANGKVAHGARRIFEHGDTVFFKKGDRWLGSAPGLADTYYRE